MLAVGLLALAALLLLPGLLVGPSLDASVFVHVTGRMLDGATLYVDTWDHKPPGIFLAEGGARLLLGWWGAWPSAWVLSVVATAGLGLLVAGTLRRLGIGATPQALAAIAVVVAAAQPLISSGGGMTEPVAALPAAAALSLAVGSPPSSPWRLAAIGALLALSVIVSPLLVAGSVALGVLAVTGDGRSARGVVAQLIGAAVPLLAVVAWLAGSGALVAAVDAIVTYNAAYQASNAEVGLALTQGVLTWVTLSTVFVVPPLVLGILDGLRGGEPARRVTIAVIGWIGLDLVLFVLQGRFIEHYLIAIVVPIGVLAGLGLDRLLRQLTGARSRSLLLAPFVLALAVSLVAGSVIAYRQMKEQVREQSVRNRVGALVAQPAHGGAETLLVWGNEPGLYLTAELEPATRYSYLYPLTTPGYATPELVAEMLAGLEANPPGVIVDAGSDRPGSPGFLPLLIDRPVALTGRDLDLLDTLRAFVADRYVEVATEGGWPIYLRLDLVPER